jgi:uncharacterized membrane protein YphA (DoxX/SURF4 family)
MKLGPEVGIDLRSSACLNCAPANVVSKQTGMIERLHTWATAQPLLRVFTVIVRVLLALAFVPSGLVKIMGQPFTTLPVSDPVGYFFAGFFSAPGYYQFIGVAQWLAGGLLLIPRTATLGALVYLPIVVNIFAITIAIGPAFAGTRVVTGAMVAANLYLLCWDWDRWRQVLPSARTAESRHGDLAAAVGLLLAAGVAFWGVTATHLARVRHESLTGPMAMIALGASLVLTMLVATYRRAKRGDWGVVPKGRGPDGRRPSA